MRMRAAVAMQAGKPLNIEDVELDGPQATEVLVQYKAAGLCHTDAFTLSGRDPEGLFPCVLGHEAAGVVVEVGKEVKSVRPGDHVIALHTPECRACAECRSGRTNLCSAIRATQGKGVMPDGNSRLRLGKTALHHFMGVSAFAEYGVLPEIAVAKIRRDAPWDKAAYIGCGVTTGVGAAVFTAGIRPGERVAVFGLGSIGLNVVQGARLCGASQIIGIDKNPQRRALATRLGLTDFINPDDLDEPLVPYVIAQTGGGVDASFECIGNTEVMRQALEICHKGWGQSVIIGVAGSGEEICTRPFQLVTGRVWKGSAFGGARGRTDVPKIVDWYMNKQIEVDCLIDHVLPLDRINEGLGHIHDGCGVRTVLAL